MLTVEAEHGLSDTRILALIHVQPADQCSKSLNFMLLGFFLLLFKFPEFSLSGNHERRRSLSLISRVTGYPANVTSLDILYDRWQAEMFFQ